MMNSIHILCVIAYTCKVCRCTCVHLLVCPGHCTSSLICLASYCTTSWTHLCLASRIALGISAMNATTISTPWVTTAVRLLSLAACTCAAQIPLNQSHMYQDPVVKQSCKLATAA